MSLQVVAAMTFEEVEADKLAKAKLTGEFLDLDDPIEQDKIDHMDEENEKLKEEAAKKAAAQAAKEAQESSNARRRQKAETRRRLQELADAEQQKEVLTKLPVN
jgi:hypothetical protein